ncbi:MAG: SPOR domain-containing protein [Dokdonella sp.]
MKHRLLGAAVLIALAVIFVPMFLSGSGPGGDSETVNLQIPPAPDREFQTRVLATDSPSAQPSTPDIVQHESLATVETGSPARIEQPDATVALPAATPAAEPHQESPAPTPKPESQKPESPKPTPAKPASEPVAAPAVSELPGTAADGTYFVHLGDYSNAKNANDLVATLKSDKFPAIAESSTFRGQATTRVRVGPYASRVVAESVRLKISQSKVRAPATVVQSAHDATADAPASALPAGRAGAWAVQIGAFATVADANRRRDQLRDAGFVAFVDDTNKDGQKLWRVRAGPETERANAEKLRDRIRDKLRFTGVIVTQP